MQQCDGQPCGRDGASGKWHGSSGCPARRCGRCWNSRRRPGISDRRRFGAQGGSVARHHRRHSGRDKNRPRSQRHTAKQIFERIREQHGYTGGYTIVKDYVRQSKLGAREMREGPPLPSELVATSVGWALYCGRQRMGLFREASAS
jgi:hypothetical protein